MRGFQLALFLLVACASSALSQISSAPTGCETVTCPPLEPGSLGIRLPNPKDCASFCKCDWEVPTYFECPAGLHFNAELQVCDWPEVAGCIQGEQPTNLKIRPSKPPVICSGVTCPENSNAGLAIHLANPGNCSSFCKCDWGVPIYFDCPAGLHFNPVLEVCDWPEAAGCNKGGDEDITTEEPTIPTSSSQPSTAAPPAIPTTTKPTISTNKPPQSPVICVNVTCPENSNAGLAIHLPNPGKCSSFCKCDWGVPIYFDCPAGLHFNPALEVCDWPANVGCIEGDDIFTPEEPTTTETISTTTKPSTTTRPAISSTPRPTTSTTRPPQSPELCPNVVCPENSNAGQAIHLPNPEDCSTYCVCDWGRPILMPCIPGLLFNPATSTCDWPSNVVCNAGPGGPGSNPGGPEDNCKDVVCPAGDCGGINFPNPGHCDSFCRCTSGTGVFKRCPPGLQFNPALGICDYSSTCESDIGVESTTPSEVTPPSVVTPPSNSRPICTNVVCPEINGIYALHLPNPGRCDSFCKCDWGTGYLFDCPDGLHFNAEKQVCDWPRDAGCVSTNA